MSQTLSLVLSQEMRLEQRLTPQLIQSMEILQLPLMALEARINEEMETNPVLEVAPPPPPEEEPARPAPTEPTNGPESTAEAVGFQRLDRMSREYDFDPGDRGYGRARFSGERDAKMDAMANTASRPISLREHLSGQWTFVEADAEIKGAGEALLDYIEGDGYLRTSLDTVAQSVNPPLEPAVVEAALVMVQTLDPLGVGARDLKECLLIQLAVLPGDNALERTVIENHLVDLEKNRYPAIAKATDRSIEDIKAAVQTLRKLNPHPGSSVAGADVPPIMPDVLVEYDDDDGYSVRLARGNNPRLQVSSVYKKMAADRKGDKDARDFLRRNLESAGALIDAIRYRRERLLELAKVVVARQREFLEQGPQALKVLRMSELAEQFGCDPSTISRTVADKYLQTPRGIYPMRYFFTGGTESSNGEATSWDSVKEIVRDIIEKEDKKNPLNDDQVVERLKTHQITISRRTVAKYRQQLTIPSARQRKEF